jgi:hypothetical protein
MHNNDIAILDSTIPSAAEPVFQHLLNTYASETNKVYSVWRQFSVEDMPFRVHERSSTVDEIMKHQLLSERRFFGEFIGLPEPAASEVLPQDTTPQAYANRLVELAVPRLKFIADKNQMWWLEQKLTTWCENESGFSGVESCTLPTTAHSLRFIFECLANRYRQHTDQPPTLPGREQIRLVLSRPQVELATHKT